MFQGKHLQNWMNSMGLTGEAAAGLLGVKERTIRYWLADKVRIPKTVPLACTALSFGFLIDFGPPEKPPAKK